MIGMCGEFPADQLNRLIPSASYAEKLITDLKAEHLIRTHSPGCSQRLPSYKSCERDAVICLAATLQCYLTGNTETNPHPK